MLLAPGQLLQVAGDGGSLVVLPVAGAGCAPSLADDLPQVAPGLLTRVFHGRLVRAHLRLAFKRPFAHQLLPPAVLGQRRRGGAGVLFGS